ncbi:MAG: hypothetical protein WDZ51_04880 [Pirellulaceae bacterium]
MSGSSFQLAKCCLGKLENLRHGECLGLVDWELLILRKTPFGAFKKNQIPAPTYRPIPIAEEDADAIRVVGEFVAVRVQFALCA